MPTCEPSSSRSPEGKLYKLDANPAVLFVRPRGWHMVEKHFPINGSPISASLFDFGLYFFHNFRTLLDRKTAPYFYLPKLESHREARLWNDVFIHAQEYVGIPQGTIRATVLIETISAAFEMDEILYELRDHSAGLNCGRWDYIFSFIKKFRCHPKFILPERGGITMEQPFLRSYVELLIHTCHKRGIHAMGGMAAQIPIRDDPDANEQAMERVRQDKLREVRAGHDGTWVAHPGLVPIAKAVFDEYMKRPNQIRHPAKPSRINENDLIEIPLGRISEEASFATSTLHCSTSNRGDVGGFMGTLPLALVRLCAPRHALGALRLLRRGVRRLLDYLIAQEVEVWDLDLSEPLGSTTGASDSTSSWRWPSSRTSPFSTLHGRCSSMRGITRGDRPIRGLRAHIAYWPKRVGLLRGISPLPAMDDIYETEPRLPAIITSTRRPSSPRFSRGAALPSRRS